MFWKALVVAAFAVVTWQMWRVWRLGQARQVVDYLLLALFFSGASNLSQSPQLWRFLLKRCDKIEICLIRKVMKKEMVALRDKLAEKNA